MRILGVDPGTLRTGFGLVETDGPRYRLIEAGLIQSPSSRAISERLYKIYHGLLDMIRVHRPEILALEDIFYGKDLQAMVKIGEARACAMLAASEEGIGVIEYAPARVKQSILGNGRAAKEQIQFMVQRLLHLRTLPQPDTADALAVALCHAHNLRAQGIRHKSQGKINS